MPDPMEKRALLAIALSAGILLAWQVFFVPKEPPPPPAEQQTRAPAPPPRPLPRANGSPMVKAPSPLPLLSKRPLPEIALREVAVETPRLRVSLSNEGVQVRAWEVKFRGARALVPDPASPSPLKLLVRREGAADPTLGRFSVDPPGLRLDERRPSGEVRFAATDPYGLKVTQTFRFTAQEYGVGVTLRAENLNPVPQQVELGLLWQVSAKPVENTAGEKFQRALLWSGGKLSREGFATLPGKTTADAQGGWVGVENDYYMAVFLPRTPGVQLLREKEGEQTVRVGLVFPAGSLGSGQARELSALLYAGPKEYDRLRAIEPGLENAVDFGAYVWWLSIPLLWFMNFLYTYLGNYGLAIIGITILVKILFYPLTHKSMSSMKAMQALQPQINALRNRYKDDRQRLNQETMALYKKHKVNPMGGCLPIVIQIPVFFALYTTFSVAVELQGAPLFLWIRDLSKADPYYVLPILMGASMFIQQKMTPTVGDPRQAKMMLLMPVVFTYFFLNLPTGLVLYWLINNVLSIGQQYYMDRRARARGQGKEQGPGGRPAKEKESKKR